MKRINILLVFFVLIYGCKGQNKEAVIEEKANIAANFTSIGAEIDENGSLNTDEMTNKYRTLAVSDTLNTKFSAKVTEVCQAKGCWMKLRSKNIMRWMVEKQKKQLLQLRNQRKHLGLRLMEF